MNETTIKITITYQNIRYYWTDTKNNFSWISSVITLKKPSRILIQTWSICKPNTIHQPCIVACEVLENSFVLGTKPGDLSTSWTAPIYNYRALLTLVGHKLCRPGLTNCCLMELQPQSYFCQKKIRVLWRNKRAQLRKSSPEYQRSQLLSFEERQTYQLLDFLEKYDENKQRGPSGRR